MKTRRPICVAKGPWRARGLENLKSQNSKKNVKNQQKKNSKNQQKKTKKSRKKGGRSSIRNKRVDSKQA